MKLWAIKKENGNIIPKSIGMSKSYVMLNLKFLGMGYKVVRVEVCEVKERKAKVKK